MQKILRLLLILIAHSSFAQSGINWSPPLNIAANSFGNQHPRVVVDASGDPLVLWGHASNKEAWFSRWNGTAFSTPLNLNAAAIPVFAASWAGPDLAAKGDTVYVVYKHTPEDTNHIYLVHSYDGGVNFSAPKRVDFIDPFISRFPAVSTDAAGNPLVAFMKFDPGFTNARYVLVRSGDFGNSFTPDVPASGFSGGYVCDCCPATVVSSGDKVATLYRDNLNNVRNMWAGISTDGGVTFVEGIQMDETNWVINSCPSSGPDGVIIGDSLYTVFMSGASGKALCYVGKASLESMDAGTSTPLTGNFAGLASQNFPRIAGDGAAVAVVWKQQSNNAAQLGLFFTDNISGGFPPNYDTLSTGSFANADVYVHAGTIHVVWENLSTGSVTYRKGTYSTTGVSERPAKVLSLYPNPVVDNRLSVRFDQAGMVSCSVRNSIGQEVLNRVAALENGALTLDLPGLPQGVYYLVARSGDSAAVAKFIKQ